MKRTANAREKFSPNRTEELCVGVFAIAITILVLSIEAPKNISGPNIDDQIVRHMTQRWPDLLSFAASFVAISRFWLALQDLFDSIEKIDRKFFWHTIIFLMWICLLPLTTDVLGDYAGHVVPIELYGANTVMACLSLYYMIRYADSAGLMRQDFSKTKKALIYRVALLKGLIALTCCLVGLVYPWVALWTFLALPILMNYIISREEPKIVNEIS